MLPKNDPSDEHTLGGSKKRRRNEENEMQAKIEHTLEGSEI